MILKQRTTGLPVEILDPKQLFSLFESELIGRYKAGNNLDFTNEFKKSDLIFTSGEELPLCWLDPHYRDDELKR